MKRRILNLPVFLGAVLLLLIFLRLTGILAPVENIATMALGPVAEKFYAFGKAINFYFTENTDNKNREYLETKINELKKNLLDLKKENTGLKILAGENEALKKQLGFFLNSPHRLLNASVLSKDYYLPSAMIIDRGEKDGVRPGYAVVAENGILVGKVTEASERVATVLLLTSQDSRAAGTIVLKDENINGLILGEHNLTVKMELLPKNADIKIGDTVASSGLEEFIPAGLLIGEVLSVEDAPGDLFKNAIIKPEISYNNLKFVSVILPD